MPGESEIANGQVPQLQVQDKDIESVILQNGGTKKVETEKTETQNEQKCELKKVDTVNQLNESVGDQQKEVEKVEQESIQSDPEQCQLKQVETESVEPESEQCELEKLQNKETELAYTLRSIGEEIKINTEFLQIERENQQSETDNAPQCVLKKVEQEEELPSCPIIPQMKFEEPKVDQEEELPSCPIIPQMKVEEPKVEQEEELPSCPIIPQIKAEEPKVEQVEDAPSYSIILQTKVEEPKEEVIVNGKQNQDTVLNGSPKKVSMFTTLDLDAIKAAYEDVRSDGSETQWAVFKFQGSKIALSATGAEFEKFREQFTENERGFGYIRIQTGDEMSKRQKFLFVTWIGPGVSVIQRAKMSTDKSLVKNIISNFAVELQLENESDFDLKHFVTELNKAGGANYGTGIRDY